MALAVVPAVARKVEGLNEGWLRWTTTLALIGYAVTILDNYWAIIWSEPRANAYVVGNEATRMALTVPGGAQFIDIKGWLGYGAVGLWMIVVSALALRGKVWPRPLSYLGFLTGLVGFLIVVTMVYPTFPVSLVTVAGVGGLVLAPAWFIWMGIILLRVRAPAAEVEMEAATS